MVQQVNRVDDKIIIKLQKLLALSASDNENEASLAMSKAEQLMREHNLSLADVAMDGSGADVESAEVAGLTLSVQKWERTLGGCIANAFNGRSVYYRLGHGQGWEFTFVAGRTDLIIIVDLYKRLRQTIKRMSKAYVDANRSPYVSPRTQHNSYRLGMVDTVWDRLIAIQSHSQSNHGEQNAYGLTGTELLVVKQQAVDNRLDELFDKVKAAPKSRSNVDLLSFQQGQDDGKNISLHRSVEGSTQPAALGM
ncbi:MAG TPA: DUF2786 domain-containing protein [Desulfobulbaceae bacterium]|nr:DUF2786 domain-containing protein [Desulfobulbaceae bacterium]